MNPVARRPDHRHLTHKRASWLGVFAMLMMFIGPLISQSMPMAPSADMPMDMSMGMPMAMSAADMDAGAHPAGHDHSLHPLWEKCGYCSLFFHTPALPQSLQFFAAAEPRHGAANLFPPQSGHAGQPVFPGARTRAPPSLRHV